MPTDSGQRPKPPAALDEAAYNEDANGIGYLDDGFGNCWLICHDERCDLQIVRPGKVQCSDYCEEETSG